MNSKTFAAGISAVAALTAATAAVAQAPAAPVASPPLAHGAPIPGVCVVNVDQVVATSAVGRYMQQRLQQISQQANAELNGENAQIQSDAKALDAQRATLDQTTFEQRGTAIQVRYNAWQRKVQQREREVQVTEQKAVNRVLQEADGPLRQAYQQKGCAVLLQHQALAADIYFNPAMDVTPQVISGLNAKIQSFQFDRERLDQQAAPTAAAGGVPPIVQTPSPVTPRPAPKK